MRARSDAMRSYESKEIHGLVAGVHSNHIIGTSSLRVETRSKRPYTWTKKLDATAALNLPNSEPYIVRIFTENSYFCPKFSALAMTYGLD